jgi:phage shock protein E
MTVAFLLLLMPVMADASKQPTWWPQAVSEAAKDGFGLVTHPQLKALYSKKTRMLVVDVRPDYEYRAGHLPEAKNLEFDLGDRLDLSSAKRAAFKALLGQTKDRLIVIYCRSFR